MNKFTHFSIDYRSAVFGKFWVGTRQLSDVPTGCVASRDDRRAYVVVNPLGKVIMECATEVMATMYAAAFQRDMEADSLDEESESVMALNLYLNPRFTY
jgi:hypothetical protein